MAPWAAFCVGSVSALVVEFLTIHRQRYLPATEREPWLTSWFYWSCVVGGALVGGGLIDGVQGTVLSSIDLTEIGEPGNYMYFVEWDPFPGVPVGTNGGRVRPV